MEGTRYAYDLTGNRIHEIQLPGDETSGERYIYDSAGRLIGVQYGVKDVTNPNSGFEKEVRYELGPAGTWSTRTIIGPTGGTVEHISSQTNERHGYRRLGHRQFEYDFNGNRTFEFENSNENSKKTKYLYDYANRLVGVRCCNTEDKVVQTIEYVYDAFSRQVLKHQTDEQVRMSICVSGMDANLSRNGRMDDCLGVSFMGAV